MNRISGNWLQRLTWLLAFMLTVQPLVASHCSCSHADEIFDFGTTTESRCCSKADGCKLTCCGSTSSRQKSERRDALPVVPCECPPSCPCQLQHLPRSAVKAQEVEIESAELSCWFFNPTQAQSPATEVQHFCLFGGVAPFGDSGLALCAALCRFLI